MPVKISKNEYDVEVADNQNVLDCSQRFGTERRSHAEALSTDRRGGSTSSNRRQRGSIMRDVELQGFVNLPKIVCRNY